jgi:uncharacterized phage protein gp47/JayE
MAFAEITPNGFVRKSLQEIRSELRDKFMTIFGLDIDLSPSSPDGLHIDLESNTISDLVELAQAVLSCTDPSKADGVFLDIVCDYLGIRRIAADYSRVDALFAGPTGTIIPAGTRIRYPGTGMEFSTITQASVGELVRCVALSVGPYDAPNGAWVLVTAISGISVSVPYEGSVGRYQETDEELRLRRKTSARTGRGTDDTIKAYIEKGVNGVSMVSVTSNRTMHTDQDGRPPKSFEAIVQGGDDAAVAQAIWESQPAGIESFGHYPPVDIYQKGYPVTDSSGRSQYVRWTRPDTVAAYFRIVITQYEEEALPRDFGSMIATAISEWATTEYLLGKDVIPLRVVVPVLSVPGILSVDVTAALSYSGVAPEIGSYTNQRIAVSSRYKAITDNSKIVVVLQ